MMCASDAVSDSCMFTATTRYVPVSSSTVVFGCGTRWYAMSCLTRVPSGSTKFTNTRRPYHPCDAALVSERTFGIIGGPSGHRWFAFDVDDVRRFRCECGARFRNRGGLAQHATLAELLTARLQLG